MLVAVDEGGPHSLRYVRVDEMVRVLRALLVRREVSWRLQYNVLLLDDDLALVGRLLLAVVADLLFFGLWPV